MNHVRAFLPFFLALAALLSVSAADVPPGPSVVSLDAFKSNHPPFYFKYNGGESDQFIADWTRDEKDLSSEGGALHRFTWSDPATKLKVTADVRTFTDYPALDWVIYFTNEGAGDTPILEGIKPLHWAGLLPGSHPVLHYAHGSWGNPTDFEPQNVPCEGGASINSFNYGSSMACLPFYNLQSGDDGVIGAIGWSDNWSAEFAPNKDRSAISVTAGMGATHLLLHAGEKIRTPRILLLPWHGDLADSQNLWRRLALAYYSPRDQNGKLVKVPICWGSWGGEPIDAKLKTLAALGKLKAGIEVYWIDAGWYGDGKDWMGSRGSWDPAPSLFPKGLAPLGDATKQAGLDLLLWMAPEQAASTSTLYKQHPGWFYPYLRGGNWAIVRLGNPDVLKNITDLVYNTLHTAGATWFRQDCDAAFVEAWNPNDKPDRVGMDEITYITNFYAFWDALRARIPNLQIDNCDSGGRRLDLETLPRSVSLWRSDAMVNNHDPAMQAAQAQGLIPWVPLSGGVWGFDKNLPLADPKQLYGLRSAYCAGLDIGGDSPPDWLKTAVDEYKEVQPYFYGDFYPLRDYSLSPEVWSVWQLDRPDLKSGVVLLLRRGESPYASMASLPLRAIDPAAQYDVEVRPGLDKVAPKRMTGKDLLNLGVPILDKPGSALVFYRKV